MSGSQFTLQDYKDELALAKKEGAPQAEIDALADRIIELQDKQAELDAADASSSGASALKNPIYASVAGGALGAGFNPFLNTMSDILRKTEVDTPKPGTFNPRGIGIGIQAPTQSTPSVVTQPSSLSTQPYISEYGVSNPAVKSAEINADIAGKNKAMMAGDELWVAPGNSRILQEVRPQKVVIQTPAGPAVQTTLPEKIPFGQTAKQRAELWGERLGNKNPTNPKALAEHGFKGAALAGSASDLANQIQRGNVGNAVVDVTGLGSGLLHSLAKTKRGKALGALGMYGAPGIRAAQDLTLGESKATGGLIQGYHKGKVVEDIVGGISKKLNPAGKSGAQVAREASYVHDVRPTHEFSIPKKLSIQDLQNKVLIGVPGDRSLAGHALHDVNGVPLSKPVELYGGPRYGQRQLDLGNPNFWASQQGAASALQNKVARAAEETGKTPYGIYTAMAPDSSNYALHHTESLLGQLDALNPRKKDIQAFDKMIRSEHPSFFGLRDPDVMEQLRMDPEMRKMIAERLNKSSVYKPLGLPSGEATTHAITEPALRDVATGHTGYSVGELNPHAKLELDIAGDHPTYNTKIPGEFKGEMIAQLPWHYYFPDVAKKIQENPRQSKYSWGTFKMGDFNQPVTQQMIDTIAPIEERILKGYSKGKLVEEAASPIISATKKLVLPPAENAARTQIIGTLPTYEKAANIFQQHGATGQGIDFGAGLGEGAKALGKDFHTYEPFAQNWTPTFRNAADVPSDAYGKLTNLNVLNVVPREVRDEIVKDIGRVMQPGGHGIITTRGKDVMNAKGLTGPEPLSIITSRDTYQKGFTKDELEDYIKYMLGNKFDVNRLNLGPAGVLIQKKAEGGSSTPAWQRKEGKNPEGGLNAAGRASYNRETGGNLKAPQPEGGPRKDSFCARMEGMKKKLTSSETANDPDSRINKSLRKWKC